MLNPTILLVSGTSGSGQSFLINELADAKIIGVEASRFLSRTPRPDDNSSQVFKSPTQIDRSCSWYYIKYGQFYGFSIEKVLSEIQESGPVAFIAGDLDKLISLRYSIFRASPETPVGLIRLCVPNDILAERLRERKWNAERLAERLVDNSQLEEFESRQVKLLRKFSPINYIENVSVSEAEKRGINQSGISPQAIRQFGDSVITTTSRFVESKLDELSVTRPIPKPEILPSNVTRALKELGRNLAKHQIKAFLKGGVCVAWYGTSASLNTIVRDDPLRSIHVTQGAGLRTISFDIDWMPLVKDEGLHCEVLKILSASKQSKEFADYWQEGLFHSRKLCSSHRGVDLDCVSISRIQPRNSPFTFEFFMDGLLESQSRNTEVANIWLVPPELILVEKLLAGRGKQLGKFDYLDAASVIMCNPICENVLTHLITQQHPISGREPNLEIANALLPVRKYGFRSSLISDISDQRLHSDSKLRNPITVSSRVIKQLALLDRVYFGTEKLLSQIDKPQEMLAGRMSISEAFDNDVLCRKLSGIQAWAAYTSEFVIGRSDIHNKFVECFGKNE